MGPISERSFMSARGPFFNTPPLLLFAGGAASSANSPVASMSPWSHAHIL